MNLQEQISRIQSMMYLNESNEIKRRVHIIDQEIKNRIENVYKPDNICRFESGEELLDVIAESTIDSVYWSHFEDYDNFIGWHKLKDFAYTYIVEKYGDKIKEYYHINCGD